MACPMDEQTALWDCKPERRCEICRFCAELVRPYTRSDGATIYGYCFKSGDMNHSPNMGKGYPIFIPLDCGATCKSFKKGVERHETDNR